jgi:hypothetical protein
MTAPNFLDGFVLEDEFCTATGICRKTAQRYRNMADGLPHMTWGGKTFIGPADQVREWLLARVKRRNPTRKRAAA